MLIIIGLLLLSPNILLGEIGISAERFNFDESSQFNIRHRKVDLDTVMVGEKVYYKKDLGLKNPGVALLVGFFPGFFIHGLGHLYIGHRKAFGILFGLSVPGTFGLILADQYISLEGGDNAAAALIFLSSVILFAGTWIYDWLIAPEICGRENQRIIEDLSLHPFIKNNQFGNQMGIRLDYRF